MCTIPQAETTFSCYLLANVKTVWSETKVLAPKPETLA